MSSSAEEDPIPSVKDLASSEPSHRRRNLNTILSHLKSRSTPLTQSQSQQLWRAFSVALMLHDSKSALSVQGLISTLCETFRTMYERDIDLLANLIESALGNAQEPTDGFTNVTIWHTAFWTIVSREWSSLDQWRMNKFLLLIRLAIRAIFDILFTAEDKHLQMLLSSQISILTGQPLSPNDRQVPDGLRLHVLDVWLDELQRIDESPAMKRKTTTEDEGDEDEDEAEDDDEKAERSDMKISRKGSKRQKQHLPAEEDGTEDEEWAGFDDDAPDNTRDTMKPNKFSPADVIYSDTSASNGTAYAARNDTASNAANTTKTTEETLTLPPISSTLNQNSKAPSTTPTALAIDNEASLSRSQIRHSLMQPIHNLAKDGLSRSVRTKAKDVIKTYEEMGTE